MSDSLRVSTGNIRQPLLDRSSRDNDVDDAPIRVDLSGTGRPGSSLPGQRVAIRQAQPEQDAGTARDASLDRLAQPKPGLLGKATTILVGLPSFIVKGTLSLAATVVAVVGGGVLRGAEAMRNCVMGASAAQQQRDQRMAGLGQPKPGGVMSRQVLVPESTVRNTPGLAALASGRNADGRNVARVSTDALMEAYRGQLGGDARISAQEMRQYINYGERLVDAMKQGNVQQQPGKPHTITIANPSGNPANFTVKSSLETTRAITWFLAAKAVVDNAPAATDATDIRQSRDQTRPPTLITSGAMIAKDPGNRLFNFMASADNAYGRVSTHCQERSDSVDSSWLGGLSALWKGGICAVGGAGISGQPLQHGIEDFQTKMPGPGGTLLFDKLRPSTAGGDPEIYLKTEEVGVPNVIAFDRRVHADEADGWGASMSNRGAALKRNIGHLGHFAGNADQGSLYRGEKMEKGEAKRVKEGFEELVSNLDWVSRSDKRAILSNVTTYGAAQMERELVDLLRRDAARHGEQPHEQPPLPTQGVPFEFTRIDTGNLRSQLADLRGFMGDMGADLGIARKGGEVHVTL